MHDESNKPKRTATNFLNTVFTLEHINIYVRKLMDFTSSVCRQYVEEHESEKQCTRKHIISSLKIFVGLNAITAVEDQPYSARLSMDFEFCMVCMN